MTNAPEGAFKIPNFIDQLEPAKFGFAVTGRTKAIDEFVNCFRLTVTRNIESIDNPGHRVFSCRVCY